MTLQKLNFSPAMPIPPVWDDAARKRRVMGLKAHLDPTSETYYPWVAQHVNIRAIIQAYEMGTIGGTKAITFKNGIIVGEGDQVKFEGTYLTEVSS
jgi:hypothetical protein